MDRKAAHSIHPKDRIRIIRALEVIQLTGSPFSELTRRHSFSDRRFLSLNLCLDLDREVLYTRINARAVSMIDSGLIGELEALLDMGYSPELKPMQAIGYRHALGYLNGAWDLDEAIRLIQRDTRRYAKRQLTWFRADPTVIWVNPDDTENICNRVTAFYAKA